MKNQNNRTQAQRFEEAKALASHLMHLHYCDGDSDGVTSLFAPQFSWIGAGEEQYVSGRAMAAEFFHQFNGAIPPCVISDEEYDVIEPLPGLYIVTGRLWIATAPGVKMYLKVHQRVTFVFQESGQGLLCAHIHCSNPYEELVGEELFPEKIGKQSFAFVQERLAELEAQTLQQNRQLDVVLASIAGGFKISNDDASYSFAYVSEEAAALFGYTVEEFLSVTGGSAVGTVYPPDLEHALADCAEAFRDGGLSYSTRYRVRCKDGTLKWVLDSGKKSQDKEGNWLVNSLYLDVTRAEEDAQQLRAQTQLLSSIYDTVPCGIVRFVRYSNGKCDLISLNQAALSLLGYGSMEEGLDDWHDGVLGNALKEDQEILRKTYQLLRKVGDRQDREYRVRWGDGSLHWLDGTNMVVDCTEQGDTVIQRTLIDITPRKTLQQQLEQEQEMYRVAMESSSDTMFEYLLDADLFISYEPQPEHGVIRRALPRYSQRLKDTQFVHPEDAQVVRDNICGGRAEMFEARFMRPEIAPGEYRWHRVSSRLIIHDGQPCRVVGTIRNIHKVKETLSENSERLHINQSALQAISGVFNSIFYVNLTEDLYYAVRLPQVGEKAVAFPRSGNYSTGLCDRLLSQVEENARFQVARVCNRERLIRDFSHIRDLAQVEFHPIGSATSWLRLELHPVSMDDAQVKTAIVTLRNISGEKQQELERLDEEKAAKQALEEAYEGARRANLAKSDFLSRMSHDIRTPMNAILGMALIAQQHLNQPDRLSDCLDKIRVSGNHLLSLINEVLDMSKIESGSIRLSENTFLLSDTLSTVVQMIRPDAERKGQRVTLRTEVKNDAVCGDSTRLEQILLNLMSNAVKYTGTGGHITLSAEQKLSSQSGVSCLEFTVEDNGIGMTKEFQRRLFLPFERADDSRVTQVQGTGLGLAITHNLVQMMNGNIRVQSCIDQGTRFTVTLFLKVAEGESPCSKAERNREDPPFPPGTRILLVEDNELNCEIARELLNQSGLETECVADGQQAVDLFISHPPGSFALILMDIQMPVLDGYGATRAIRSLGETGQRPDAAKIPIIALTANAFADDAYRAQQAGMNEHVTKPLEIDRLIQTLHRWLD